MKKTILTILLCGVMVLGITGCGEKENKSTNDGNVQESQGNTIKTLSCEQLTDESNISSKYEGMTLKYDESKKEFIEYKIYNKMVFASDLKGMNEQQKDIFIKRISLCSSTELLYGDTVKSCDSNRNGDIVLSELYFNLDKFTAEDNGFTKKSTFEDVEQIVKEKFGSNYNTICITK